MIINRRAFCHSSLWFVPLIVCVCVAGSCSETSSTPTGSASGAERKGQGSTKLSFPEDCHVEDDSVNRFIQRSMQVCSTKDYDGFRALWSTKADPIAREQFEEGWHAVREIRIRAVEKVRLVPEESGAFYSDDAQRTRPTRSNSNGSPSNENTSEVVYAVLAMVSLDPEHPAGRDGALKNVVVMLVEEENAWRITWPPRAMRKWLREKAPLPEDSPNHVEMGTLKSRTPSDDRT